MGWATRFLVVGVVLAVAKVTLTCSLLPCTADLLCLLFPVSAYHATMMVTFTTGIITTLILVLSSRFRGLMPWGNAGLVDMKDFLYSTATSLSRSAPSKNVVTLIGVPSILLVASLYAIIFHKNALVQYDVMTRLSLEHGWLFAVICITTYLCLRSFEHGQLTNALLAFLRMESLILLEPLIWLCLGRPVKSVMWLLFAFVEMNL